MPLGVGVALFAVPAALTLGRRRRRLAVRPRRSAAFELGYVDDARRRAAPRRPERRLPAGARVGAGARRWRSARALLGRGDARPGEVAGVALVAAGVRARARAAAARATPARRRARAGAAAPASPATRSSTPTASTTPRRCRTSGRDGARRRSPTCRSSRARAAAAALRGALRRATRLIAAVLFFGAYLLVLAPRCGSPSRARWRRCARRACVIADRRSATLDACASASRARPRARERPSSCARSGADRRSADVSR